MPAASAKPLSRKITAEEAMDGFLTIEKAWLKKLPSPGTPFQLKVGKDHLKVSITTDPACGCRGKPHEHHKISLPLVTLVAGQEAVLRPVNDGKVVLETA